MILNSNRWIQTQILWFWIHTWIQNHILRFWIQIAEFKIIFCDFDFKSLNSESNSVILNSNPWIQNHIPRFWIQIPEFKIIFCDFEFKSLNSKSYALNSKTSLHRLECMPVEAAIFWAYTGFFTDLQFFFHSWKSLEDAQSWQIYSRSTCHTPSHHAAQPVCWASPWASSGYGALPTLSAPSCGTWCVQSCMHGQGRRLYSSNHEAHHSQGPELIDHRHIHLTWESNFIFMLMCMFWALTKYILNDEIHSRYSVVPPPWPVWIAPWCNCKACHESAQHLVFECACSCHTLWFEPPSHTRQTYSLWNAGSTSAFTGKTLHQLVTKRTHWAYTCWIWLHGQKLSSAGKQKYSL